MQKELVTSNVVKSEKNRLLQEIFPQEFFCDRYKLIKSCAPLDHSCSIDFLYQSLQSDLIAIFTLKGEITGHIMTQITPHFFQHMPVDGDHCIRIFLEAMNNILDHFSTQSHSQFKLLLKLNLSHVFRPQHLCLPNEAAKKQRTLHLLKKIFDFYHMEAIHYQLHIGEKTLPLQITLFKHHLQEHYV